MTRKGDWIQTHLGIRFYPLDPRPEEVEVQDIAHALSLMCRFGGHIREFYSVAQHSVYVSQCVPKEYRLWALLHDAAEAYISDLCAPVKRSIRDAGIMFYHEAEALIMGAVCRKFGLSEQEPACVKLADRRMLATEKRLFDVELKWQDGPESYDFTVEPLDPSAAEAWFLSAYEEYRE